jgi:hypothetical protein
MWSRRRKRGVVLITLMCGRTEGCADAFFVDEDSDDDLL